DRRGQLAPADRGRPRSPEERVDLRRLERGRARAQESSADLLVALDDAAAGLARGQVLAHRRGLVARELVVGEGREERFEARAGRGHGSAFRSPRRARERRRTGGMTRPWAFFFARLEKSRKP